MKSTKEQAGPLEKKLAAIEKKIKYYSISAIIAYVALILIYHVSSKSIDTMLLIVVGISVILFTSWQKSKLKKEKEKIKSLLSGKKMALKKEQAKILEKKLAYIENVRKHYWVSFLIGYVVLLVLIYHISSGRIDIKLLIVASVSVILFALLQKFMFDRKAKKLNPGS